MTGHEGALQPKRHGRSHSGGVAGHRARTAQSPAGMRMAPVASKIAYRAAKTCRSAMAAMIVATVAIIMMMAGVILPVLHPDMPQNHLARFSPIGIAHAEDETLLPTGTTGGSHAGMNDIGQSDGFDSPPTVVLMEIPRQGSSGYDMDLEAAIERLKPGLVPISVQDLTRIHAENFQPLPHSPGPGYTTHKIWYRMPFAISDGPGTPSRPNREGDRPDSRASDPARNAHQGPQRPLPDFTPDNAGPANAPGSTSTASPGASPGAIVVHARARSDQRLYLELAPVYLNEVDVTILHDGDLSVVWHGVTGDHIAPDAQTPRSNRNILAWPVLPSGVYWLVIGVNSNSAHSLQASLKSADMVLAETASGSVVSGIYLGTLLIGFVVYFSLGILIGDRNILWYGAYAFSLFVLTVAISGFARMLFVDIWPLAADAFAGGGGALTLASSVMLWLNLLDARRNCPRLYRGLTVFAILTALCALTATGQSFVFFAQTFFVPYFLVLLTLLATLVYYGLFRGQIERVGVYLLALGILVGATGLHLAMLGGLVSPQFYRGNVFQSGSMIHLLALGFAIARQTYEQSRERIEAFRNRHRADIEAAEQREFITMLAHEFRTPLAVIQRAADMVALRLRDGGEPVQIRLTTIRGNAAHLSELVNVFLTKDSLDRASFGVAPRPTLLLPFLGELIARRHRDVLDQQVHIGRHITATVNIDRTLFERAILNLLENARKYAPGQPVHISIRRHSDGMVYLLFSDPGPGIPAEDLANVSQAFYRGSKTASTQGVGLGLHLTSRIIAAHAGEMSVSVGENGGTAILIKLPFEREAPADDDADARIPGPGNGPNIRAGRKIPADNENLATANAAKDKGEDTLSSPDMPATGSPANTETEPERDSVRGNETSAARPLHADVKTSPASAWDDATREMRRAAGVPDNTASPETPPAHDHDGNTGTKGEPS